MKLMYDGELFGEITTNHSLTLDEALDILGYDRETRNSDEFCEDYDYDLFEMSW